MARELIATGRTAKQVTGFKGRSGRSFRAKLALVQNDEGRWRVEFDEAWAKEGAKPPEAERAGGRRRGRRRAGRRDARRRVAPGPRPGMGARELRVTPALSGRRSPCATLKGAPAARHRSRERREGRSSRGCVPPPMAGSRAAARRPDVADVEDYRRELAAVG